MTQLRFAPIVRVSTETQEKAGESLNTQRGQIERYVKNLGGVIPADCWEYSGQEHATPNQERIKLEKLLADAPKGKFDAVIVCDTSRWSRDNRRSKDGLDILRDNGIRFFVAGMEYDLHSPSSQLMLGVFTEFHEFYANELKIKSIQNRITRAKRGLPATGKLPYGRTFDPDTEKWGLDGQKARNIQWAAEQYLSGKSLTEIAKALGENPSNLWKVLTKRSGDKWEIEFNPSSMKFINEIVTITIPRLLPEATIKQIHERAAANKTYTHGEIKHKYLLSHMIFCADCGYALFGQTNHPERPKSKRFYRHPREGERLTSCSPPHKYVDADKIEHAVILLLFNIFGDRDTMEKAIQRAIPNPVEVDKLRSQLTYFEEEIKAVQQEKQNLIRSIAKGILTDDDAAKSMEDIRGRESVLNSEINKITPQLENIPTKQHIERHARFMEKVLKQAYKADGAFVKMTYEAKRELVTRVFAGKDAEGKRRGVYMKKTDIPDRPWEFTIRGIFGEYIALMPLTEYDYEDLEEVGAEIAETSGAKFAWHYRAANLPECRFPEDMP
jgi:DNA invertase Pin-like site-specific DNA recombinase/predicted transcriptional regulator